MMIGEQLAENDNRSNKRVFFRYSRVQRRKELKTKKYQDIREQDKLNTVVNGLSIKEWESKLSKLNANTCIYENWTKYLQLKSKINNIIDKYYVSVVTLLT